MFEDTCGSHGGRRKNGELCGGPVIAGTKRCRLHSGKSLARARAEGAIVVDLRRWGLTEQTDLVDPGETMLRLVTQSAMRVDLLAAKLGEAYDAAERLKAALEAGEVDETALAAESCSSSAAEADRARRDLMRVFNTGGISAFVGFTYSATKDGDLFATGEAIRGLAAAEAAERERCANFATKAIAAGLAERQVRLAERQAALMAGVFGRVLQRLVDGLGALPWLSASQREELIGAAAAMVPSLLAEEVGPLAGLPAIEGGVR